MKHISYLVFTLCLLLPIASVSFAEYSIDHSLYTIKLSINSDSLWDEHEGILANGLGVSPSYENATWRNNQGKSVQGELWLSDNDRANSCLVSLDKSGSTLPQKGLIIELDDGSVYFLTNAGEDGKYTRIANYLQSRLLNSYTDVTALVPTPVVLELNGEYWGHYYLITCTGYTEEIPSELTDVDIDSFLDWIVVKVFFGDIDFTNCRGEQTKQGWKPLMMGFDFGLMQSAYNPYIGFQHDQVRISSLIHQCLEQYQDEFLTKLGSLYHALTTEVMQSELDISVSNIEPEMIAHFERWAGEHDTLLNVEWPTTPPEAYVYWQTRIERMREGTIPQRHNYIFQQTQEFFGLSDEEMAHYFD